VGHRRPGERRVGEDQLNFGVARQDEQVDVRSPGRRLEYGGRLLTEVFHLSPSVERDLGLVLDGVLDA